VRQFGGNLSNTCRAKSTPVFRPIKRPRLLRAFEFKTKPHKEKLEEAIKALKSDVNEVNNSLRTQTDVLRAILEALKERIMGLD